MCIRDSHKSLEDDSLNALHQQYMVAIASITGATEASIRVADAELIGAEPSGDLQGALSLTVTFARRQYVIVDAA